MPPGKVTGFQAAARAMNVPLTEIGTIVEGEGARIRDADDKPLQLKKAAYSHF